MKIFLDSFAHLGVNEKAFNDSDVAELIEAEDIELIETPGKNSFYFTVEGVAFIAIPKREKGIKRLFLILHEISHHFKSYGKSANEAYFHGLSDSKEELEADAFATVCLCPRRMLGSYEFLETHPNRFAKQLYENRQKLNFLYGV